MAQRSRTNTVHGLNCSATTGPGQLSATSTNGIVRLQDVTAFERALERKDGAISNALAAQLGRLTSFSEKQIAADVAIRSVTSQTEAVACAMMVLNAAASTHERCLALCDLGYVYVRFKDFHAATSAFHAMLASIPRGAAYADEESYSAHRGLAMAHMMRGDYLGQLRSAEAALVSARRTGNQEYIEAAQDEVAMGLINTRQFDAAREILQQRLRNDPDNGFVKMLQDNAEKKQSPVRLRF